jgi:hypothetical protein
MLIILLLAGLAAMPCYAEFRDPTQPAYSLPATAASNAAAGNNEPVLSAIWISPHSRRATINGVSGKPGQTIIIGSAPTLSPVVPAPKAPSATADKKDELLNKVMQYTNAGTSHPALENSVAPLLAAAIGNKNLAQLLEQGATSIASKVGDIRLKPDKSAPPMQPASMQMSKTAPIPAGSSTIKIISIDKNSVTIDKNGELKTLQLIQRPYITKHSRTNTH